jgi:hypothetical protein
MNEKNPYNIPYIDTDLFNAKGDPVEAAGFGRWVTAPDGSRVLDVNLPPGHPLESLQVVQEGGAPGTLEFALPSRDGLGQDVVRGQIGGPPPEPLSQPQNDGLSP